MQQGAEGGAGCTVLAAAVTNPLGFSSRGGPQAAGTAPAAVLSPYLLTPPYKVVLCLVLNSCTQAVIQQGRRTRGAGSDPGSGGGGGSGPSSACSLSFQQGQCVDTRGARVRTYVWDRFVPAEAFIRLQLLSSGLQSNGCDAGHPWCPNSLQKLTINGIDCSALVQGVAEYQAAGPTHGHGGVSGCLVKAACVGNNTGQPPTAAGSRCCEWFTVPSGAAAPGDPAYPLVSWGKGVVRPAGVGVGLADLPIGTEIIVGPIGAIAPP